MSATSREPISSAITGTNNPTRHVNISLPNFTVHFRSPDINNQDKLGRYGFDYPRDEDFYPIEKINGQYQTVAKNIVALQDSYWQEVTGNYLKEFGYIPAWLYMFPNTTNDIFAGGSNMHAEGIALNLQIHENYNQGLDYNTTLLLSASDDKIVVSPTVIPVSDFQGTRKVFDIDKRSNMKKQRVQHTLNPAYAQKTKVIIKLKPNTVLTKHACINIHVDVKGQKILVGMLMVHKNNITYKSELVLVKVRSNANSPIFPSPSGDVEYYLKRRFFNQALIRAEVVLETKFDLVELSKTHQEVRNFLDRYDGKNYVGMSATDFILNGIKNLYEKYGDKQPKDDRGKVIKLDDSNNKRTFVFITDFDIGYNGLASYDNSSGKFKFGNYIIIFKPAKKRNDTLAHELGHSFGLFHVFESIDANKFQFHQGYSNKVMDYLQRKDRSENKYIRRLFMRHEWYIMQKDQSVVKAFYYKGN